MAMQISDKAFIGVALGLLVVIGVVAFFAIASYTSSA